MDPKVLKSQYQLAEAYLIAGLEKQTVEHASQALKIARDIPNHEIIMNAAFILGKAYAKLGEFERVRTCNKIT